MRFHLATLNSGEGVGVTTLLSKIVDKEEVKDIVQKLKNNKYARLEILLRHHSHTKSL